MTFKAVSSKSIKASRLLSLIAFVYFSGIFMELFVIRNRYETIKINIL